MGKRDHHLARAALRQLARDRRDAAALRQIVGKVRLTLTPWLNHGWQVPLYVTARGLGTSPIPAGREILELEFDFMAHRLVVRTSRDEKRELPLEPQTVAAVDPCPSHSADKGAGQLLSNATLAEFPIEI
jgi:Family of unknown function (DUF5996)